MKKFLLITAILAFITSLGFSQIVYEDFEGTPLEWNPFGDGVFNGVIDNPDTNFVNNSAKVGSYTKSDQTPYSLLITVLDNPIDLSTMNQFSIDVYAPVATQVLLKLEGDGEAIEATRNIANTEVWQRYHFDFSGAATFTTINKIIIFFDPGVTDSDDTYLFDNIMATAAGPCAGTVPDPMIADNFECQRNVTYGAGWDIITPISNPDASGINTSSMVGQYEDPLDEWSALVLDYHNPIDLSTNSVIKAKIWSPKTCQILFKLEGGTGPDTESWVDVTETDTWVEYKADFSDDVGGNYKRIAIFFNAGVTAEAGDIYYIDDIGFEEAPPAEALEDFEDGANLSWGPLNDDATNHGTFDGVMANPDMSGINDSPNVGSYTKGNATFSTLTAFLPSGLDLSTEPQLNLQVLAPAGSENVTMQLVSPTQGNKEVTRDLTATEEWVQLEFNFEEFDGITDFERVNILFDPGIAAPGTSYMYDNLIQSGSTVDPCEGVVPNPNILDDYECQRNVTYGVGADRLTVIDNPDPSGINISTKVGEYKDVVDEWSALGFESGGAWDLSVLNQFHIKIWSSIEVPILFKLEGGTSPAAEIWTDVTVTGEWVEYVVDFSSEAMADHARIAVFFNGGQLPNQEDVYYIDDISWTRDAYTGCIINYEEPVSSIYTFNYFSNGHLEAEGLTFEAIDNPNPTGINTSDRVGKFIKASDADPWAGMYTDLDAPIDFGTNKTAKAMVHMDHIGNFAIKLEDNQGTGGADFIEVPVDNTVENDWEELTFDFSEVSDDASYRRLTVFFDLLIDATGEDVTSYFDNIVIGDGNCSTNVSAFEPIRVESFQISPNPVQSRLLIENTLQVETIAVFNSWGQQVHTMKLVGAEAAELNVAGFSQGMYILAGYNKEGQLVANAKFVVE